MRCLVIQYMVFVNMLFVNPVYKINYGSCVEIMNLRFTMMLKGGIGFLGSNLKALDNVLYL
jgi:hypothetical protein